jgi:hypothetical protein
MAYYSIFKRIKCKNWKPYDIIGWYSHQLYIEWYNSLTKDEKEYLRQRKEKKYQQFKQTWAFVCAFISEYYIH